MLFKFFFKKWIPYVDSKSHVLISFCMQIYICKFEMNLKSFIQHSCTEEQVNVYGVCVYVYVLSYVQLFVNPWTVGCQAPLSMRFSRQEYWSGLLFPSSGESCPPRDWTCVSCISCIGRQILLLLHHLYMVNAASLCNQSNWS